MSATSSHIFILLKARITTNVDSLRPLSWWEATKSKLIFNCFFCKTASSKRRIFINPYTPKLKLSGVHLSQGHSNGWHLGVWNKQLDFTIHGWAFGDSSQKCGCNGVGYGSQLRKAATSSRSPISIASYEGGTNWCEDENSVIFFCEVRLRTCKSCTNHLTTPPRQKKK